jgi:alpha-mannosidase
MTTQANHKRNMRDSEEQAINAEKYASLAWLEGKPYPGDDPYRSMEEDHLQRLP